MPRKAKRIFFEGNSRQTRVEEIQKNEPSFDCHHSDEVSEREGERERERQTESF